MRSLVAPVVAVALLASAGASLAAPGPAVTLSVSTFRVLYGHPVTLSGRISTGQAGRHVVVYAQTYGGARMHAIGSTSTRSGGNWQLKTTPAIGTTYQVRSEGVSSSPPVAVGVVPLVRVHQLEGGRIWTEVAAGHSLNGRFVKLQKQVVGGWATLDQRRLGARSTTTFAALPLTSAIRIVMSVNEAGAGYLGAVSHPIIYHAHILTLGVSTYRVTFGESFVLTGRLGTGRSGETVTIKAWPYGASSPHRVARVTTGANGTWAYRAAPAIQTTYSATWGALTSRSLTVGVEPSVTVRRLSNGNIWTHVAAVHTFPGRVVQLQRQLPSGVWQTIARRTLNGGSTATFAPRMKTGKLRVAMSVNQAGAGFLGALSSAFGYHGS
jgi:hypothetical protein